MIEISINTNLIYFKFVIHCHCKIQNGRYRIAKEFRWVISGFILNLRLAVFDVSDYNGFVEIWIFKISDSRCRTRIAYFNLIYYKFATECFPARWCRIIDWNLKIQNGEGVFNCYLKIQNGKRVFLILIRFISKLELADPFTNSQFKFFKHLLFECFWGSFCKFLNSLQHLTVLTIVNVFFEV